MARRTGGGCSLAQGVVTGEADSITATDRRQRAQVEVGQAVTFESHPPRDCVSRLALCPKCSTPTKTVLTAGDQTCKHISWWGHFTVRKKLDLARPSSLPSRWWAQVSDLVSWTPKPCPQKLAAETEW